MDDIGRRIRAARKDAGLSQEALARRAGMSLNGMASIERGEIGDPHISTLSNIAAGLGVPVEELLGETAPVGKDDALPWLKIEEGRYLDQVRKLKQLSVSEEDHRRLCERLVRDPLGVIPALDELAQDKKRAEELVAEAKDEALRKLQQEMLRPNITDNMTNKQIDALIKEAERKVEQLFSTYQDRAGRYFIDLLNAGNRAATLLNEKPEVLTADEIEALQGLKQRGIEVGA